MSIVPASRCKVEGSPQSSGVLNKVFPTRLTSGDRSKIGPAGIPNPNAVRTTRSSLRRIVNTLQSMVVVVGCVIDFREVGHCTGRLQHGRHADGIRAQHVGGGPRGAVRTVRRPNWTVIRTGDKYLSPTMRNHSNSRLGRVTNIPPRVRVHNHGPAPASSVSHSTLVGDRRIAG